MSSFNTFKMVFLLMILDILYTPKNSLLLKNVNWLSFLINSSLQNFILISGKCITFRPYSFCVSLPYVVICHFISIIHILKIIICLTILNNVLGFNIGNLNSRTLVDTGYTLHPNQFLLLILWDLSETRFGITTQT